MKRYLEDRIVNDLEQKMVFLWWPRQVGKTTLSQQIWSHTYSDAYTYLNRDNIDHKKKILSAEYDSVAKLIIFDEIHKYDQRKTLVKWEYDVKKERYSFMVTGSARLDIFKKWWDSLLGRYRYFRLHPYSYLELVSYHESWWDLERLLEFWWFPESYEEQDDTHHTRWKNQRKTRLVREDVRDLTDIRQIGKLELLVSILESKVWSQFSIKSLIEDIQVTHKTLSHWVDVLEYIYYAWRVYPLQSTRIKSLRKEPRLYLRDRSEVTKMWARIENMIGSHLLKRTHWIQDSTWRDVELRYLRDREWREVDFALVEGDKVLSIIEVKKSSTEISKHLTYFKKKLEPDHTIQVVFEADASYDKDKNGIRVVSAEKYLLELI